MKTSQYNRLLLGFTFIVSLFIAFLTMSEANGYVVLGVLSFVFILCFGLFYKLDVSVKAGEVSLSFGIGLIKKSIPIERISSVTVVRNSPLHGWGVRFTPDFTLYNVSGLDAIELTLKDQSRRIRIGTSIPHELAEHISKRLGVLA